MENIADVIVFPEDPDGSHAGTGARAELDACMTDRRTEFLEVSSPFASTMKGMWERSDPTMQMADQAEIMKLSVGSSNIYRAGIKRRDSAARAGATECAKASAFFRRSR